MDLEGLEGGRGLGVLGGGGESEWEGGKSERTVRRRRGTGERGGGRKGAARDEWPIWTWGTSTKTEAC